MFENCNTMSELNEARLNAIKQGTPPVIVNKEYGRRKSEIFTSKDSEYRRVPFVPVEFNTNKETIFPIEAYWDDDNPYVLYIPNGVVNG